MHHFVVEALREEQERTKSVSLFGDICRATIANFFYSYGKKLNIPNLTPSMVRRAYGSYLIEQGVDFVKLADLLDDNINTLYRTYRDTLRLTSVDDEQKIVNM
jgi:site-specific recombinase XerD